MLVGEAKTLLKAYGFDDTDPLLTMLEAGKSVMEQADDWPFLIKGPTIIAMGIGVVGVSGGTLPADIFKIMSIRDNTQGIKLKEIDPLAFDRDIETTTTPGLPQVYSVFASTVAPGIAISIWPASTQAWSLQLRYQATMVDITGLADGVSLPGPTQGHLAIVQGAAYIALQIDNEEDRAQTAQDQFDKSVGRLRRKYFSSVEESETVQNVMGY